MMNQETRKHGERPLPPPYPLRSSSSCETKMADPHQ
jgi:hypothetical protein